MKLFHGTSSAAMEKIKDQGLQRPFLTDREDIAWYYAECAVDELGGEEVVLVVEVEESQLRYDQAAMIEPVMADESDRDAAWERASTEHPEWIQDGYLDIPAIEYAYSLRAVFSVRCEGVVSDFEQL